MVTKLKLRLILFFAFITNSTLACSNCSLPVPHVKLKTVESSIRLESTIVNIANYNINQAALIYPIKKLQSKIEQINTNYFRTIYYIAIMIVIFLLLRYRLLLWQTVILLSRYRFRNPLFSQVSQNRENIKQFLSEHLNELVEFLKHNNIKYTGSFNGVVTEANLLLNSKNDNNFLYKLNFTTNYMSNLKKQLLKNTSLCSLFGSRTIDIEYYAYCMQYLYNICSSQARNDLPLTENGSTSQLLSWVSYKDKKGTEKINTGDDKLPSQNQLVEVKYRFSLDRLNHPIMSLTAQVDFNQTDEDKINYCLESIQGVKFSIIELLWYRLVSQYKFIFMLPLILTVTILGLINALGIDYDTDYLKLYFFSDKPFRHPSLWFIGVLMFPTFYILYPLTKWIIKSRRKVLDFQAKINSLPAGALDFAYNDIPIFHPDADHLNFSNAVRNVYYGFIFDRFFPNKARFIILDAPKGMGKSSFLSLLESKVIFCTPELFTRQVRSTYPLLVNPSFYPIFRQEVKKENIVFIWISILDIANILQASTFRAEELIKLIAKKAPAKYANIFLNLIEDIEVSMGWFKVKFSGFSKAKSFDSKIILVIEDIDRKPDLFHEAFQDLSLLQSIPNLIVILPLLKKDIFEKLENLGSDIHNNKKPIMVKRESIKQKQGFRSLYNKLIDNEIPFGQFVYLDLASLYIEKIIPKNFLGRLNIDDGDEYVKKTYQNFSINLTSIDQRESYLKDILKRYITQYLEKLFNQLKIDIRTFKKIFLYIQKIDYGNHANFIPDLFIDLYILVSHYQEGDRKSLFGYRQFFNGRFPEIKYYFYAIQKNTKEEPFRLEKDSYYNFCLEIAEQNSKLMNSLFINVPGLFQARLLDTSFYIEFQNAFFDWLFWIYNPAINDHVEERDGYNNRVIYMIAKLEILTTPSLKDLTKYSGKHVSQVIDNIRASERFKRLLLRWGEILKCRNNLEENKIDSSLVEFIDSVPSESRHILLNFSYLTIIYSCIIKNDQDFKIYKRIAIKIIFTYQKKDELKEIIQLINNVEKNSTT